MNRTTFKSLPHIIFLFITCNLHSQVNLNEYFVQSKNAVDKHLLVLADEEDYSDLPENVSAFLIDTITILCESPNNTIVDLNYFRFNYTFSPNGEKLNFSINCGVKEPSTIKFLLPIIIPDGYAGKDVGHEETIEIEKILVYDSGWPRYDKYEDVLKISFTNKHLSFREINFYFQKNVGLIATQFKTYFKTSILPKAND